MGEWDNHEIEKLQQELKSSEDRTRLIMASIPAGFLVVNGCIIEAANSVIERLFGFSRAELAQQPLTLLFPGIDVETMAWSCESDDAAAAHKAVQFFARKVDGRLFPCEITTISVPTKAGARQFIFVSDITERYELEQLKRDFVAMVSHDLNTPLTSVMLCLEAIKSGMYGTVNPSGEAMIDRVRVDVTRLIGMISDLLCLDKLESGKLEIRRKLSNLETVSERALSAVLGPSQAKSIKLTAQFSETGKLASPSDLEELRDIDILLDEDRMVQVLVNLLSNAIKFSPSGAEVTIHAWLASSEICFAVVDHGDGIADELKRVVFEKYKQLDPVRDAGRPLKPKGFGLGLAICKSIVEQHGGRIWVEDSPVCGSTFQIRIPPQG